MQEEKLRSPDLSIPPFHIGFALPHHHSSASDLRRGCRGFGAAPTSEWVCGLRCYLLLRPSFLRTNISSQNITNKHIRGPIYGSPCFQYKFSQRCSITSASSTTSWEGGSDEEILCTSIALAPKTMKLEEAGDRENIASRFIPSVLRTPVGFVSWYYCL